MIKSFKHKQLERLFSFGVRKGINANSVQRLERILWLFHDFAWTRRSRFWRSFFVLCISAIPSIYILVLGLEVVNALAGMFGMGRWASEAAYEYYCGEFE